ncbi:hypothetical protein C1646_624788 [Rhizophagus diaphanus]|nr:hypothetical protein C1646_624788 [Rhizophagus diaphanus] [Rhizophagus sp. MUCL 43196]
MFKYYIRTYSNFNLLSNKNLLFRFKTTPNYFSNNKINILQNVIKSNRFVINVTNLSKNDNIIKVYSGPLSGTAKKLKILSMASLIGTIALTPFIMIVDAPIGLGARIIFIIMALSTSALSTGLIHLCFSPYVRNIYYNQSISSNQSSDIPSLKITPDSFLTFETLTLFGRSNFTTLPIKSLEPSFRFFTTWNVKKLYDSELTAMTKRGKKLKPKKLFYVHSELCDNKVMQGVINNVGIN